MLTRFLYTALRAVPFNLQYVKGLDKSLLITEFEVNTASYELSYICQKIWPKRELHVAISLIVFFRHELQPKQNTVNPLLSTPLFQGNKVNKPPLPSPTNSSLIDWVNQSQL